MSFLNPLASLFLLSAPLLVLLYFLKLKRPRMRVPSTLLWRKVIEDIRVNSPFQKLRRSLLLLLQLLILICAIAALTRPLVRMLPTTGASVIALLDVSASMSAVEEDGKTRLEQALARLADFVDHMGKADELMIVTFSDRANVVSGFTDSRRKLRNTLASIEHAETRTDVEPALRLAKSACHTRGRPRVLLFSDGAFPRPQRVEMPVDVEYQLVGTSRPNLAVTGLDVRRSLNDSSKIIMFVSIENFSDAAFSGNMIVRLDGAALDIKYFSVSGKETLSQVFEASLSSGGNIDVQFDVQDALACDNRAWKVILPPTRRRVLLVGERTFFLERALKASPNTEYMRISGDEYSEETASGFTTVVWNGVPGAGLAPCDNLYFDCVPEAVGFSRGEETKSPEVLDWDATHPLNRFIDFGNLRIDGAFTPVCPENGVPVLRGGAGPLVVLASVGDVQTCVVGFDPMRSNWPLLVSFPLFLNNCLSHFDELRQRRLRANIEVGQTLSLDANGGAPVVRLPDGSRRPMRKSAAGAYVFADTTRCGMYEINRPDGSRISVSAGLFDRRESELSVVPEPALGGDKLKAVQLDTQVNREFWKLCLAVAGAILVLEWTVYHRRWLA